MDHMQDYVAKVRGYFQAGSLQKFMKGTVILSSEDDPQAAYYISAGYIRIYSINSRGEQYTHVIYGPGEIFPLIWLIRQQRFNTCFESLTNTELYCVPLRNLLADLQTQASLAYGMMQQIIEQYRIYSLRVDNLEYKYASERLAYCLVLLANRFGEHNDGHITIVPSMTHQLLGSTLNLSRESVSREMEKLMRRGLVHYNPERQIVIPDIKSLAEQLRVPLDLGLTKTPETIA